MSKDTEKQIREMFFKKYEMFEICKKTNLTERIIRRIINEHNWINKRERYYRFLCWISKSHSISLVKIIKRANLQTDTTIYEIRKKYKISPYKRSAHNKRITNDIEDKFINDYKSGLIAQKIADKYGFKTDKTVLDVLKKHNIDRREPKVQTFYNEKFFEKIDSKEKAYFLGFIMTDGYIIKDYNGFGIQISSCDGYVLDILSKLIGSTNPIQKINMSTRRKIMPNAKDMNRFCVTNSKIARDLKALGVTKHKSKTLRFLININKKYLSHFFRGLIDGDGTIGIHSKNGNIWCQLCSASKKFIYDLKTIKLPFIFSINRSTSFYGKNKDKKCKMYALRVGGGNKKTIKFLKWLYKDKGNIYLRRKYERVQNYIG